MRAYKISILTRSIHYFKYTNGIHSAVLIPLIDYASGPTIILTKRTENLQTHRGQVCFPGGRIESNDFNPASAALREAHEEINLPYKNVTLITYLSEYRTLTGFLVTPVVGLIYLSSAFSSLSEEVNTVFKLPFVILFDPCYYQRFIFARIYHVSYSISYQRYYIWGATAAILADLCWTLSEESKM